MAGIYKGQPEGAPVLIPRLFCRDPLSELEFCRVTFGASELNRRPDASGAIAHVLVSIGPAMLMIESGWPQVSNRAPLPDGSSPVVLYVYVDDVDATVARGVAAGARVLMPPAKQFWGDRTAWIIDPAAHVWTVAMRVEETSEDERQARLATIHAQQSNQEGQ